MMNEKKLVSHRNKSAYMYKLSFYISKKTERCNYFGLGLGITSLKKRFQTYYHSSKIFMDQCKSFPVVFFIFNVKFIYKTYIYMMLLSNLFSC